MMLVRKNQFKMSEMHEQISKNPTCKRIRQFISIPFMWEEKPGIPKKDWKPPSLTPQPGHIVAPLKLIASVPFLWEEKPGIPLPCFSKSSASIDGPVNSTADSVYDATPQTIDIIGPPSPPRDSGDDDDDSSRVGGGGGDNEILESELDLDEFYSDDSFSSASSIMEIEEIPTIEISSVTPLEQTVQCHKHSGELQCSLSPASQGESSTSSYATRSASIGGHFFLEWLFPLLTPSADANGNRKVGTKEEQNHQSKEIAIISKPLTLGELIMMSRRKSYQRKAMRRIKSNQSMELMKSHEFGCCMLGAKNGMRLLHQKWKTQFQLKLV